MVPMRARCSYALAPGVKEAAALDRYAATVKAYDAWERELLGRQVGRSRVRRGAGGLTVDRTILVATPEERAMYAALYAVDGRGGSLIRSTARVRGGRLVLAVGGADEEAPPPAAAAPIAAAALAEARGADAVAIFDPASFLLQAGGRMPGPQGKQVAAMTTAIPGLGTLAAPLVVTSRGGPAATVELAVPIGTLVNVAQVVRPFLGVMGAGAR
jgi:hypothetical protein